jgi:hypothetical protein
MLIVNAHRFGADPGSPSGTHFVRKLPLVPDLNPCMSKGAVRRCRQRTIDEHFERHGDG